MSKELHEVAVLAYVTKVAHAIEGIRSPVFGDSGIDIKAKFYFEGERIPLTIRNDSGGTICVEIGDDL